MIAEVDCMWEDEKMKKEKRRIEENTFLEVDISISSLILDRYSFDSEDERACWEERWADGSSRRRGELTRRGRVEREWEEVEEEEKEDEECENLFSSCS